MDHGKISKIETMEIYDCRLIVLYRDSYKKRKSSTAGASSG
jgi:hypothetical protein